ncbi:MAG: DUF1573 domain-containing protein, partial [Planctomycetia bacterium]|nr:DUF1573 domain-containing protein [Planctomycetia bacterium]
KRKVLVHRWDSIPKRIFPKHPNANLPAMFSSTSLLFRILAFEIHDRREEPQLSAELVSPKPDQNGVVTLDSMRQVEFRWKLSNVGSVPLQDLKIDAGCQCRVAQAPPPILQPGESADIVVNLVSPNAGRGGRTIPVFRSGDPKPLLELKAVMNVLVQPPSWVVRPSAIEMRAISNQDTTKEFVWDAVEKRESEPWIQRIGIDGSDVLSVEKRVEEQAWGEDRDTILRKYRVTIRIASHSETKEANNLVFYDAKDKTVVNVPIIVELMSPIVVVPAQLVFNANSAPQKLTVLRRIAEIGDVSAHFDNQLVTMTLTKSAVRGPLVYEISPQLRNTFSLRETEVLFHVDQHEVAKVLIKFD